MRRFAGRGGWGPGHRRRRDIAAILGDGEACGDPFNCHPGGRPGACRELAFFVSLSSRKYTAGRGHIGFRTMLERFVQHMQGRCPDVTRAAVLVSDSWDSAVFDEWRANVEQVKRRAHVRGYIVSAGKSTRMNL